MPRKALTELGVERMKLPTDKRVDIADKTVPGLILRLTPRVKSWSLLYRIAGAGGKTLTSRQIDLGPAYVQVRRAPERRRCR